MTPTTPMPMALPIGMILANRYEVLGHLGAGGQGDVYKVFDHNLQQESALKLLTSIPATGVWVEAQLLMRLTGKFLLPVRNADLVAGTPYIVTEIAGHGTTGGKIVPNVGVPPRDAIGWALQAARGLSRMHDHGLVHNDLKPDNLFLDSQGDVLVGDLGFASQLTVLGTAALTGGTPATMAPEVAASALVNMSGCQLAAPSPCTVKSDVYGLGATLWWLLAGRPPYSGPTHQVLQNVSLGARPKLRDVAPHVPQGISETIEKAMASAPASRFESASAFDFALAKQTRPARYWWRIQAHAGHSDCFVGVKKNSRLLVCVRFTGVRSLHEISVSHASGRRAHPPVSARLADLPQRLRAVFRQNA